MRPRAEVLLTVGLLAAVFTSAALIAGQAPSSWAHEEASSFLTRPGGTQGLLESARAFGIGTRRYRGRLVGLDALADSTRRQLLLLLGPHPFSPAERSLLLDYTTRHDLLLAGGSAGPFMECFGYTTLAPGDSLDDDAGAMASLRAELRPDSVPAIPPGGKVQSTSPWVHAVLATSHRRVITDSTRLLDTDVFTCTVPEVARVDTLLSSPAGQPVALRIQRSVAGPAVILVSDVALFRNRTLRATDAGPFALGLVVGRYDELIFEERHHGYGTSSSARDLLLDWSKASPWGWLAWQLAVVGIVALCFGAVRFGPLRPGFVHTRRSSLEHVRALATALAAAQGHDEAIAAMIRGLRRRLVPANSRMRGEWREWLAQLQLHAGSERATALATELMTLIQPGQPSGSVYRAANAVEELWTELRP